VDNIAARKAYTKVGFRQVGEVKRFDFPRPDSEPKGTASVIYHDFVLTRKDHFGISSTK
jgi:RimJ/RimL family protein N-acetyltransferase